MPDLNHQCLRFAALGRLLSVLVLLACLAARGDPAPKAFPHPDRIRYDGQCLTINGRDTFVFAGSFDYFGWPRASWRERFRALRESGCNAVETRVRTPADPREFQDWLALAQDEFGFYTIVRPGPGLAAVCPAIAAGQVTRRPPGHGGVILVRIEGEGAPRLRALCRAAIAGGIEVPLFTCLVPECRDSSDPVLGQVFDAVTSARGVREAQEAQPDAPPMIVGPEGAGFSPDRIAAETLRAIGEGATVLDCRQAQAPIGHFLLAYGSSLARAHSIPCEAESGRTEVAISARRDRAARIYIFFRNVSALPIRGASAVVWLEHQGEVRLDYGLAPFGCKVLTLPAHDKDPRHGVWYPAEAPPPARPAPGA